jgi:hypothetical protein
MPSLRHVPVSLEWCILKRGEVEVTAILKSTGHTSLKVLRGWNEKADFGLGADRFFRLVTLTAEERTRAMLGRLGKPRLGLWSLELSRAIHNRNKLRHTIKAPRTRTGRRKRTR